MASRLRPERPRSCRGQGARRDGEVPTPPGEEDDGDEPKGDDEDDSHADASEPGENPDFRSSRVHTKLGAGLDSSVPAFSR
jgi:hypothetical protein